MKRLFFTLLMVGACCSSLFSQSRAIGARVGGNMEFSYQYSLFSGDNMIDITAGVSNYFPRNVDGYYRNYGFVGVTAVFDWVYAIKGGWNWYLGPGLGLGYYWQDFYGPTRINLNVCAQIGIEYQFKIPLTLSLDWRPSFNILGFFPAINRDEDYKYRPYFGDYLGLAIGVRYRFN